MRSACAGELFYKSQKGKRYCVLHFPGNKSGLGRRLPENSRAAISIFAEFGFPALANSSMSGLKRMLALGERTLMAK